MTSIDSLLTNFKTLVHTWFPYTSEMITELGKKVDTKQTGHNGKFMKVNSSGNIAPESVTIPSANSTASNIQADANTGSAGGANTTTYAKADHVHPKSTIYAEASHTHEEYNNVGGTNLIQETQTFTNVNTGSLTGNTYKNCAIRQFNATNSSSNIDCMYENTPIVGEFEKGDTFTLSFWAKGTGTIDCHNYGASQYIPSKILKSSGGVDGRNGTYSDGKCTFTLTENWKRYYVVWKLNPSADSSALNISKKFTIRTMAGSNSYIAGVMFERGEVAHDWSPSPLDANFYNTEISISNSTSNNRDKFNPNIDDVLVFTVTVKDRNGSAVSGATVPCNVNKGYFTKYNNTSISGTSTKTYTGTTNSNGQFTLTYKASEWDLCTFSANTTKTQINVTGWKNILNDENYTLKTNGYMVHVNYHIPNFPLNAGLEYTNTQRFSSVSEYMPEYEERSDATQGLSTALGADGTIRIANTNSSDFAGTTPIYASFTYPKK